MERGGGSWVRVTDTIAGRTLGPPSPTGTLIRQVPHVLARLTLTYRDIFGRTHATMVDYTVMARWENIAFYSDVPQDLEALNAAAWAPAADQTPATTEAPAARDGS
jgi:hypothetical protein